MSNRRYNQFFNTLHAKPVLLDCNFVVDSSQVKGVRDLKGGGIADVLMEYLPAPMPPPISPNLLTAKTYAVIAASTVTNTGSSVVTGNLALTPGTSVVGFPPGTVIGTQNVANPAAVQAKNDAQAAYTFLAALPFNVDESGIDLGTLTLLPGVYKFTSSAQLTGTLVLDAGGNPNATWVFQIGSTLTTASSSVVSIINGGSADNVYWQVGTSATLGTSSNFKGTIIANASVTGTTSAVVSGRLFALTGAVTLDTNAVTVSTPPVVIGGISPGAGIILVKFEDNFNRYFGGWQSIISPPGASPALSSVVKHSAYVIKSLGTTTLAQWQAIGVFNGMVPAVGMSFIAIASQAIGGTGTVQGPSVASGIDHIELLGDPNLTISSKAGAIMGQWDGSYLIAQCFLDTVVTAPVDGTILGMTFYMSDSRIMVRGE